MSKKIAFYGGTFDPVHRGHIDVAANVKDLFGLSEFLFVPAFHAPHKRRSEPTSSYHRFAMLCEATSEFDNIGVSALEVEMPSRPYTVETLTRISEMMPENRIFFVIGADSWEEITTWKEWQRVLTMTDIIVVTRPGYEIGFDHVTTEICSLVKDVRGRKSIEVDEECSIFITDIVFADVSATRIRNAIGAGEPGWQKEVSPGTAAHIEKYRLYE